MKDKTKKNLIFYGEKFGLEFSGGCIATCRIFEEVQHAFNRVVVISKELGNHHIDNLQHIPCEDMNEAVKILSRINPNENIFYGDFFDALALVTADVPFYFTYHDNWPEQMFLSTTDKERAPVYMTIYEQIFRKAEKVFTVSQHKKTYIEKYTDKISLIRNGINHEVRKQTYESYKGGTLKILMTGNVDVRKYMKAVPLFEALLKEDLDIRVDVYGLENDKLVASYLADFHFVKIKGYHSEIPFEEYDMYLSTSFIENLSIAVVEALKNHLPVVCFDVGGLNEVVNEQNGIIVSPYEIGLMKKAIIDIYNANISFSFNNESLQEFDWKIAGKQFLEEIGMS